MHQQQYRSKSLIGLQRVLLPIYVRQCKCRYIYSVVPCGCGKILKWLWWCYQVFSIILFLKKGRNFCCDFGMNICWYWRFVVIVGDWGQIFFFALCAHFRPGHFFTALSLSLGKYKKTPMLNELRLLLYAAEKYNGRNGKLFFYF